MLRNHREQQHRLGTAGDVDPSIVSEARTTLKRFQIEQKRVNAERVRNALRAFEVQDAALRRARVSYLRERHRRLAPPAFSPYKNNDTFINIDENDNSATESDEIIVVSDSKVTTPRPPPLIDPAANALICIPKFNRPARMKSVPKIPRYVSWIPVMKDFYIPDDNVEAFYPYYGDSEKASDKSTQVYKEMLEDELRRENDLSDGEVDPTRKFFELSNDIPDKFYYFGNRQMRAAQRHTISRIINTHGRSPVVWHSLAAALSISDTERLRVIARVVERRLEASRIRAAEKKRLRDAERAIRQVLDLAHCVSSSNVHVPSTVLGMPPHLPVESISSKRRKSRTQNHIRRNDSTIDVLAAPMRHFCFRCHTFCCELHAEENAQPVKTIPDESRENQEKNLLMRKAPYCSRKCFLLEPQVQAALAVSDDTRKWQREEILLLREGLHIVGCDPCTLSVIVGTRSCNEVYCRLEKGRDLFPGYKGEPRKFFDSGRNNGKRNGVESCSSGDDEASDDEPLDVTVAGIQKRIREGGEGGRTRSDPGIQKKSDKIQDKGDALKRNSKRHGHVPASSEEKEKEPDAKERFIPCHHEGPCTKKNGCLCILKGINCEATCGCRCGRFYQGKTGILWRDPRCGSLGGNGTCKNRRPICRCSKGSCNTDKCPCFAKHFACDPDLCHHCNCNSLPEMKSTYKRRCKNVSMVTAQHRKVLIGRSKIHGYGLYAAEKLEHGDLIGPYCGRVMPADLIDQALRMEQAEKSTYAFTLTFDLTVDAGLVGSKVKFINHACNPDDINCVARIERVRGECRICIKAAKDIQVGEEILFDYHLIAEGGNDWLQQKTEETPDKRPKRKKRRRDEDTDKRGAGSRGGARASKGSNAAVGPSPGNGRSCTTVLRDKKQMKYNGANEETSDCVGLVQPVGAIKAGTSAAGEDRDEGDKDYDGDTSSAELI